MRASNIPLRPRVGKDRKYGGDGKLAVGVPSIRAKTAALLHHVLRVVHQRSKEKMVWIDATTNIAAVKNAQIARDFSAMQNPRQSVGAHRLAVDEDSYAVTVLSNGLGPNPAATLWNALNTLLEIPMQIGDFLATHDTSNKVGEPLAVYWHGRGMTPFAAGSV